MLTMMQVLGAVLISPLAPFLRSGHSVLADQETPTPAPVAVEVEAPQIWETVKEASAHVEIIADLSQVQEPEYSFTDLADFEGVALMNLARELGIIHGLPCFEKLGSQDPKLDYIIDLELDELETKLLANPVYLDHFGDPAHIWDLDLIQMWRKGNPIELAKIKESPQTLVWYTPDIESPVLEVFRIDSKNYRKVKAIRDRVRASYSASRRALVLEQKRLEEKYTKKETSEIYE